MIMTVLRGELATAQSKALIRIFKGMKDYISENRALVGTDDIAQLAIQTTREILPPLQKSLMRCFANQICPKYSKILRHQTLEKSS